MILRRRGAALGTRRPGRRRVLRALVLLAGVATIFLWLPRLLSVVEPPTRADLLFVLPGELPARARCAARLYREGVAPRLLFSGGRIAPELEVLGRPLSDAATNALAAGRAGVPESAMAVVPFGTSTWEDAGVLRAWLLEHPAPEVLAVTSPIHSRRALLTLRAALAGVDSHVRVTSCDLPFAPGSRWWTEERPLIQVFNETAKMLLYAVRYLLPAALGLRAPPSPPPSVESIGLPSPSRT